MTFNSCLCRMFRLSLGQTLTLPVRHFSSLRRPLVYLHFPASQPLLGRELKPGAPRPHRHLCETVEDVDARARILSAVTQRVSSVAYNSLLYQASAFYRLLDSLLQMSYSDDQIIELFASSPELLSCSSQQLEGVFQTLRSEGFSPRQAVMLLQHNPSSLVASVSTVSDVTAFFRDVIGLLDGNLQEKLARNPVLLSVKASRLNETYSHLMSIFRRSDLGHMLRKDIGILLQDKADIQAKVNYVYNKMGLDQVEMVWANLLSHSLEHIQARHLFLVRAGFYEKPDKYGASKTENPRLKDILGFTDERFASKLAGLTLEEYTVFRKILAVEKQTKDEAFLEELYGDEEGDDVSSEEDMTSEETGSGYVRERVRRERTKKKRVDLD